VAAWATERAAPLHAHVSEQPAENEACVEAYGASPTELLERAGALSPNFTAVHATHVSTKDIGILGGARACCCLCPTTERDLADLVAVRLGGVRLAGASADHALGALVFAGAAADVNDAMVGGRFVVRDGAHVALDVPRELQAAVAGVDW